MSVNPTPASILYIPQSHILPPAPDDVAKSVSSAVLKKSTASTIVFTSSEGSIKEFKVVKTYSDRHRRDLLDFTFMIIFRENIKAGEVDPEDPINQLCPLGRITVGPDGMQFCAKFLDRHYDDGSFHNF